MYKNGKILITESERKSILGLYESNHSLDFVISDWLSPDEKYVIFLDELYDIKNKVKIGNIWENFDNFKLFLKHSFEVSKNVPQQIKESVFNTLDGFILTESTQNLSSIKPILKDFLIEQNLLSDFGNWVKDTAVGTVKGVGDFVKTGYEGLKKLGVSISQGDWSNVVELLKKGSLYVARKIRSAMYNPIGLILDAILVASGIGKSIAWIPWAVVVSLDIYEFITGKYEEPDLDIGWRLLFFGIDIIGLVTTGVAAKGPKMLVQSLIKKFGSTSEGLRKAVNSSPKLKSILQSVSKYIPKVDGFLKQSQNYFKTKSPMFYKFISGIMGGVGKFLNFLTNLIKKLIGGVGAVLSAPGKITTKLGGGAKTAAAANTVVPLAGFGTYEKNKERTNDEEIYSSLQSSEIEPIYDSSQF